jgi:hypothetical protein
MQQLPTHLLEDVSTVRCRRYVRVPDGRVGKVIGFYRRETESVLVRFACGETTEFPTPEVEILS